jgi:hypothetical protein
MKLEQGTDVPRSPSNSQRALIYLLTEKGSLATLARISRIVGGYASPSYGFVNGQRL